MKILFPIRAQVVWLPLAVGLAWGGVGFSYLSRSVAAEWQEEGEPVDFNRDIRPLLSDRCFLCHGPDQSSADARQTGLRLDQRESAMDYGVLDGDDLSTNELLLRVVSEDPDLQMPPPESGKGHMTEAEVALLQRWIAEGAPYESHWAYVAPRRPAIPTVSDPLWQAHPIDAFVRAAQQSQGLAPSPLADRATLIRRLTLDLTGLPPSIAEVDQFLADPAPEEGAVERVVDRLLATPQYAEQMTRYWLDASRYADTSGYQYDRERTQWVWRDWVIHSFLVNKPFDDFTVEQIAGDLLPNATDQTRLATGFHRNHPITIEGGVVDEEYRTEYVIDRVVTTSTVWLGQTFLCARCHDHKYDPVSQEDFYRFFAYFNNVPEQGLNGFDPRESIASPLAEDGIAEARAAVNEWQQRLRSLELPRREWRERLAGHSQQWEVLAPQTIRSTGGAEPRRLEDGSLLMTGPNPERDDYELVFSVDSGIAAIRLEALRHPELTNGSASRGSNGNFVLSEFVVEVAADRESGDWRPAAIAAAEADYEQEGFPIAQAIDGQVNRQGWAVDGNRLVEDRTAIFTLAEPVGAGGSVRIRMQHQYGLSHQIGRFRISSIPSRPLSREAIAWLDADAKEYPGDAVVLELIDRWGDSGSRQVAAGLQAAEQTLAQRTDFPATMILRERTEPRPTYVLERGAYDRPRTDRPLQPGIPAALGSADLTELPSNRLGLARWLVAPDQPLTARVTVNRFWQQLFGTGLVKTSEDFGFQGAYPSHPGLLDWLAVEFVESGWDVKRLLKTIVMSRTYRQSSRVTGEQLERDPANRWLSRGPRFRLDAEMIRDCALSVAGLLDRTVGGASVYPYHPEGLWLEINNRPGFSRAYPHTTDPDQLYRRTMYTFWKRTVPPPSMATFDAPEREYCVVQRSRTNTPLQALVLLHDPQFVEAARGLGARMIEEGGADLPEQITFGFRLCTSRSPGEEELELLVDTYQRELDRYRNDPAAAEQLLSIGAWRSVGDNDSSELAHRAAMTQVARRLLNLSEFLIKG